MTTNIFNKFESELPKEDSIHDLHGMHVGSAECTCTVQISHGMILDMGIKSYLNSIAQSIASCLKNTFAFGKYKVGSLIVTGSLLHKWTKFENTLYRRFIWNQLEEELCISLHHHQMRVQLIMSHVDIDLFPDEKLVKWEKYQQVLGEKRMFVEIQQNGISAKLYQDTGDQYKLIPSFQRDGKEHWKFLLTEDTDDVLDQSGISKRYYIVPNRDSEGNFFAQEAAETVYMAYPISKNRFATCLLECHLTSFLFNLGVFLCNSQNQQEISSSFVEPNYRSHVMLSGMVTPTPQRILDFKQDVQNITSFPIVFHIEPRNYDLKTKTSVQCCGLEPESSLIPGLMTLKEKEKNCY